MKVGITMLIHNKDDIEFVTEFPCFLGHPVQSENGKKSYKLQLQPFTQILQIYQVILR